VAQKQLQIAKPDWAQIVRKSPELVVLVDFVFPWGIEYPVVFLPQGLFTLWCLQMA
jgi:hypothetical protein